jgi:hypothetical protein
MNTLSHVSCKLQELIHHFLNPIGLFSSLTTRLGKTPLQAGVRKVADSAQKVPVSGKILIFFGKNFSSNTATFSVHA